MSTYKIVMQHKNSSGSYDTLLPKSYSGSFINISAIAGATLTVAGPNNYNQSYTLSSSEDSHGFAVMDDGNYSLKVSYNGKNISKNVSKTGDGIFTYIMFPYDSVLNNNSWKEISKASEQGVASSIWSIGDVKMDTINWTFGDKTINGNYGFFIIDFDHNLNIEGTGISFMGFKTAVSNGIDVCFSYYNYDGNSTGTTEGFVMNPADSNNEFGTNSGGWKSSYMRTSIIPSFKQALSSDLRNVLKTVTIYSDNVGQWAASSVTSTTDDIYLAAEFEVFGKRTLANSAEQNYQTQFTYYKNGNSKIKYRHMKTSSAATWWMRSTDLQLTAGWCLVYQDGNIASTPACFSRSFAPVFKV